MNFGAVKQIELLLGFPEAIRVHPMKMINQAMKNFPKVFGADVNRRASSPISLTVLRATVRALDLRSKLVSELTESFPAHRT